MERGPLGLHAVQQRVQTRCGRLLIDIKDQRRIRGDALHRDLGRRIDLAERDPARGSLVGVCRGNKPIRDNQIAPLERRVDDLLAQLGTRGHVQQHLATQTHLLAVEVLEQRITDLLSNLGPARLTHLGDAQARGVGGLEEHLELCALARAVWPVKDKKLAGQRLDQVRRQRRLVAARVGLGRDRLGHGLSAHGSECSVSCASCRRCFQGEPPSSGSISCKRAR